MERNGRILFSSLKGGVGKSTLAYTTALSLASKGYRCILSDLDFRSRSLDLMLGVSDEVLYTFDDYLFERCDVTDLLKRIPVPGGALYLAPACDEATFESYGENLYSKIPETLERMAKEFEADYLVCDTGADTRVPGIVADGFAEYAVVVTEQSRTSIRAAEITAVRLSESKRMKTVVLAINNFDEKAGDDEKVGVLEIINSCRTPCIGIMPSERTLPMLQNKGMIPSWNTKVIKAADNISGRILGEQISLFDGIKKAL